MEKEIKKIGMVKLAGRPAHIARVVGGVFWSLPRINDNWPVETFYGMEKASEYHQISSRVSKSFANVDEWCNEDGKVRGVVWTTPASGREVYVEILPSGVAQIWVNFIGGSLEAAKRVLEHADQYLSPEERSEIKVWYVVDEEDMPPISFEEAMAHLESVPT